MEKSREVARFLEIYESRKREKNMIDYDDVLENLVRIVEVSEDALNDIREQFLYVLVDEHQDSSRVQNEFLACTWGGLEEPNIFVVGDDRQLIYGFAGASIDHFTSFKKTFPEARLVPLLDNYRSTQVILDAAHALLSSVFSNEKLISHTEETHQIKLLEAPTPREEILAAALAVKNKISEGVSPSDCVILVPKNAQARKALEILHDLGLPLALEQSLTLFDLKEAHAFLDILRILARGDKPALARSFFNDLSGIPPLEAHKFLSEMQMRHFSLESALKMPVSLWSGGSVRKWLDKLAKLEKDAATLSTSSLLDSIGREIQNDGSAVRLLPITDIAATFMSLLEKRPDASLDEFTSYLEKLVEYGENIALVVMPRDGVRVLTMHSAKGLEFDFVWIAHMDERSLGGGKRWGFTVPESILAKIEERDMDTIKRKLFVAITRAKRFCNLSYASLSQTGREQKLAKIIAELPKEVFEKEKISTRAEIKRESSDMALLKKLVKEKYAERYISASLLNSFFECPWKWYFRSLLSLPEPENENLVFGSLVHEGIDKILKLGKIVLPEDEEVARVVRAWAERRLPEILEARESEYPLSVADKRFPHLKIYGKIDLIEKLGGSKVRVTDFKTGSGRKKSEIEKLDDEGRLGGNLRQLSMYTYLLSASPQWHAEVSESRLEFVEADGKNLKDSFYKTKITPEQIELLLKDIADYDQAVKTGEWLTRPCHYNSYGKNTECEYCKMAEIYG